MQKLLYISRLNADNPKHLGTLKKVRGMCGGFSDSYYVYLEYECGGMSVVEELLPQNKAIEKAYRGLGSRTRFYKDIFDWICKNGISIVYIRFDHLDNVMLGFFRKLKSRGVKIYLELPTFPYAGERDKRHRDMLKKGKIPQYMIKRILAKQEEAHTRSVNKYVEKIITYTYDGTIWNLPSMCIENGVDCSSIKVRDHQNDSEKVIIGCVANLAKWHAVDRVIEGLKNYYAQPSVRPVEFWIVGEGSETAFVKSLVEKYNLSDHVIFKGAMSGESLEKVLNEIDIGVGTLGLYRIGLPWGSTLKSKEYCAAGLPFFYSSREKALTGYEPFALKFEDNDSPIDINAVVEFALKVRNDIQLRKEMREKAEREYDWKSLTKKILEKT